MHLPQAELFVRQRERPGLPSQEVAWPPRLSAGRRGSGSQGPWLGEAAPQPEGNSVCAQQAPARLGFPGGSDGKKSACNKGDPGSNPGSGRSSGEGNGNSLQDSCLEIPMDSKQGRLQSIGLQRVI